MICRWPGFSFGDVLKRSDETIAVRPDIEYREVTVRLWGKGVVLRQVVSGAAIAGTRRFVARAGQFVLSRIDARNGAFGLVPTELDGAIVSNDFPVFAVNKALLLPAFLAWFSRTATLTEMCQRASEGTTNRVRLQESKFLALEVSLPPVPEQRRIVARIEELAEEVRQACDLRREALDSSAAFLIAARRRAIARCSGAKVPLEEVCVAIIDNLHSNPKYADSGVPCVRSPDVGFGTLNLNGALRTDENEFRRRTVRAEPQPDDLVFVREGGGTGKCALVLPGQRFSLGQRVMMLRPDSAKVVPSFFLHQLLSPQIQEEQVGPLCKGSASPHLNIAALKQFVFRLPPLEAQKSIVQELDQSLAEVSALKDWQTQTAAELDALMPAILDRAFRGEL